MIHNYLLSMFIWIHDSIVPFTYIRRDELGPNHVFVVVVEESHERLDGGAVPYVLGNIQ